MTILGNLKNLEKENLEEENLSKSDGACRASGSYDVQEPGVGIAQGCRMCQWPWYIAADVLFLCTCIPHDCCLELVIIEYVYFWDYGRCSQQQLLGPPMSFVIIWVAPPPRSFHDMTQQGLFQQA